MWNLSLAMKRLMVFFHCKNTNEQVVSYVFYVQNLQTVRPCPLGSLVHVIGGTDVGSARAVSLGCLDLVQLQ